MLYQFDKNMLINGDNINGLNLVEGLVSYDFILIDPQNQKESKPHMDKIEKLQSLEQIKERIVKAHRLLKEDGAMAIHIDDKEYASLRMIMDDVFGEEHYVNTFILKSNEKESNQSAPKVASLNRAFEFLVVYKKSDQFYYKNPYKESSTNGEGHWSSFQLKTDNPIMRYPIDGVTIQEGQWKWPRERGLRALNNFKKYQKHYQDIYNVKDYLEAYNNLYSTETGSELEFVRRHKNSVQFWIKPSNRILMDTHMMDYSTHDSSGTNIKELGTLKNLDTIKKIISVFTEKDSKVLDFYAGSGTTAHAIMELNTEDGGARTFTLMTNDENQMCSAICKLRMEKEADKYNETFQYISIG